MNEDKVSIEHPAYIALAPKRSAFQAVKGGTDAIQKEGVKYLPKYPAEEPKEYEARLQSSTIDGIVSGGVETLTGTFFEGEIDTSKVNSKIIPFLENIDNCGNHLNVFARQAIDASFDGCSVIVVDMAEATEETKKLEAERGAEADKILNKRPYWVLYKANDVTNWRYRENPITKKKELSMLVIKVVTTEPDGMFKTKEVTKYRVWRLDGNSVAWELWTQGEKKGEFVIEKRGTIAITRIAAAIMGELDDEPKLLTESRLEIKGYQKESSFDIIEYLSVPTFYTKGYEGDEPLALGASAHVKLPADPAAEVGYAQIDAAGHDSLKGTIREIKGYIKGRLNQIESAAMPTGEQKTATEVVTEDSDKQARLLVWAEQAKDCLEQALSYTAEFMGMGIDEGGEIVFNTKWMAAEQKRKEADERKAEGELANIEKVKAEAASK
jgi:hypothetical protein